MSGKTLFEKIWEQHLVRPGDDATPPVIYVDLHLIHEVTSPQAFATIDRRGLTVRRPDLTLATMDHAVPTARPARPEVLPEMPDDARVQIRALAENCRRHDIRLFDMASDEQGIVHVIGPELGLTRPGMTIVCGDSHTSTHGAFGALAFGIGTSEVTHVLATQCLLQPRPRTTAINVTGELPPGVTAKDLILGIIAQVGVAGGNGHVVEYRGPTIEALSMEARMTVCNMSIEMGARAGMVAPDEVTFEYLRGRRYAPSGDEWDAAVEHWRALRSDPDARYEREIDFEASGLAPMVTFGTNPATAIPVTGSVPGADHPRFSQAGLDYMGFSPGEPLIGKPLKWVFIGSCTNSRLSDLRHAARILRGRKVADGVKALIVPGSQSVRRAAEAEGLDEVFLAAGAQWRQSGCSMCVAINQDRAGAGDLVLSTSNRNFEGRQGAGARTILASPLTAAASAVAGAVADPRELLNG